MGQQKDKKRKGNIWRKLIVGALLLGLAGAIALAFVLASFGSYDDKKLHDDPLSTLLYDRDGNLILSVHGVENRVAITIKDVPEDLRDAFLAAEDLRFYRHIGFDIVRIFGALWADIRAGSLEQGASTITQQLVKNTHLTPEKTWMRKLNEAYFAYQIERDYSKDDILVMYMNHVYLGNGAYGVQAAAQAYFGVDARDLTLQQCASLAAILKAPTNYAPHIEPENNRRRRNMILETMREEGMIGAQEAQQAMEAELVVIDRQQGNGHGWFTDAALGEAARALNIDYEQLLSGGYRIHTTMDSSLQTGYDALFLEAELFPESAADGTMAQAALVAVDVQTGAVRAMMGGREYSARLGLNRATQMRRQPGSALKPFAVYIPAVERAGLTAATFINDTWTDFEGYAPRNYGDTYSGWITARVALAGSRNVPAVALLNQLGIDASRASLEAFGIPLDPNDRYLPLGLGAMTYGVSPLELCCAYAALGNGGVHNAPYLVSNIYDASGRQIYSATPNAMRAADQRATYLVTDMLRSAAQWGTGSKIGATELTAAAKTGTVSFEGDLNRDAWTAAYTPEVAIVAWMGFDDVDAEHALQKSVTGGGLPAALTARALVLAQQQDVPFDEPPGIEHVALDKRALEGEKVALLATEWTPPAEIVWEIFLPGTAPAQYSVYWQLPRTPVDLKVEKSIGSWPEISFTSTADAARYRIYRSAEDNHSQQVAVLTGRAGEVIRYTDTYVERSVNYSYYVIPEHAEAVDMGMANAVGIPTGRVGFTAPLLPFDLPSNLDDLFLGSAWDDIMTQKPTEFTSEPTASPDQSSAANNRPTPVGGAEEEQITATPSPIQEDAPLFGAKITRE